MASDIFDRVDKIAGVLDPQAPCVRVSGSFVTSSRATTRPMWRWRMRSRLPWSPATRSSLPQVIRPR